MEVHLEPDVKAKLTRLAAERGRDPEMLTREAIESFVSYDEWFIREVEKGLAQIDRGETLSHEEVGARLATSDFAGGQLRRSQR
jgi:predicted transcriptional regulator